MLERSYTATTKGYRFGFNGKEQDNEVQGQGNAYDFGARMYDARLGRWFSVDPLASKFPNISPYVYAENSPIFLVDTDGEEPSPSAYKKAAEKLGVTVAHIRAVYTTEVGGNSYLPDGRIKILYEKHYFKRHTKGKFNQSNPELSASYDGKYGSYSSQYAKLAKAVELDKEAAYKSVSVGGFQIMGENFKAAGYNSATEFVEAMMNGTEDDHLQAFVNLVKNDKFAPQGETKLESLKKGDWKKFARNYNGPRYYKNNYDTKMSDAYNKYKDDPLQGLKEDLKEDTPESPPPIDSSLPGNQEDDTSTSGS